MALEERNHGHGHVPDEGIDMSFQVYRFEAGTFLPAEDDNNVEDTTAKYAFGPLEGAKLFSDLRSEGVVIPPWALSVVDVHTAGHLVDGEIKAFVRVSVLTDGTDFEDMPDEILERAYDLLGLPEPICSPFEESDVETLDDFLSYKPECRSAINDMILDRVASPVPTIS